MRSSRSKSPGSRGGDRGSVGRAAPCSEFDFEALYRQLAPGLQSFFVHQGWSRVQAEDGVQEVFLRILKSRKARAAVGSQRGFAYRIARNLLVDTGRSRKLQVRWERAQSDRDPGLDDLGRDDPARACGDSEDFRKVLRELDRLPEHQRTVLLLKKVAGLKGAEIARVMGIPEGTVASRLHHALIQIRKALGSERIEGGCRP